MKALEKEEKVYYQMQIKQNALHMHPYLLRESVLRSLELVSDKLLRTYLVPLALVLLALR